MLENNIYTNFCIVLTGCIASQVIYQSTFLKLLLLIVWTSTCITGGVIIQNKYSLYSEIVYFYNKRWSNKKKDNSENDLSNNQMEDNKVNSMLTEE